MLRYLFFTQYHYNYCQTITNVLFWHLHGNADDFDLLKELIRVYSLWKPQKINDKIKTL